MSVGEGRLSDLLGSHRAASLLFAYLFAWSRARISVATRAS
jgi:hypothetical protein